MTHSPTGQWRTGNPGQPDDPRAGAPGVNPWIPSLESVLEKHQKPAAAMPPPGATGFTGPPVNHSPRPVLYGARAINEHAIPEYVPAPRRQPSGGNNALVLLILLVVLAAGGGAGYWYLKGRDVHDTHAADAATAGRTLAFPTTLGRLHKLGVPPSATNQLLSHLTSSLGSQLTAHAQVGIYTGSHKPIVVAIAFRPQDNAELYNEMLANGVAPSVDRASLGMSTSMSKAQNLPLATPQRFDPGSKGGSMSCVDYTLSSGRVDACIWADRSYLTLTMVERPASLVAATQLIRQLREAAEH